MTRKPADFAQWAALPMAHTSKVEGRIQMILDTTRRRTFPRRILLLAALTGAAAVVPLSMLQPTAKAQAALPTQSSPLLGKQQLNWTAETQYARENSKFLRGQQLSPEAAAALEKQLAVRPNDYAAHLILLGYFLQTAFYKGLLTKTAARAAYRQQVFWLIRNHPESLLFSREILDVPRHNAPAAFAGDEALWQAQFAKHPSSAVILGNAAEYYLLSDNELAEKYLLRAQTLEPKNPEWHSKLAELYRLNGPHPSAALIQKSAKKALVEYEAAAALAPNKTSQHSTSADLAKTAFDAGEYDKARQYANALLKRGEQIAAAGKANPAEPAYIFQENSDAVHEANMVLGRLALHDGDLAGAEAHLLAMGRVSGSSTLNSFGPNMKLAQELLERGDRAPVLAYFDECAKFWHDKQLGQWRSEVEQGKTPDFRGNLDY